MPDTPVAPSEHPSYDPVMEARVTRLEEDWREMRAAIVRIDGNMLRMESSIAEIKAMLAATLPHLATKADVAAVDAKVTAVDAKVTANDAKIDAVRTELKAEFKVGLAEKPSKTYMWGILTALLTAYACGLAALAILK